MAVDPHPRLAMELLLVALWNGISMGTESNMNATLNLNWLDQRK